MGNKRERHRTKIERNNKNKRISISLYVQHPDNDKGVKPTAFLDIAETFINRLYNDYGFYKPNFYRNNPIALLKDRIQLMCAEGMKTRTLTNMYTIMNKDIVIDFLKNYTSSNYKAFSNYNYEKADCIDSCNINNLFFIINTILSETDDNFDKVFSVRYLKHKSRPDCLIFTLNLEALYKYLPSHYKCNYSFDYHLVYSFMLIWIVNIVFSWLNDLKLIDDDKGMFPSIPLEENEYDYIEELFSLIEDNEELRLNLINTSLNTLFEVSKNAICNKLECSCEIALPFSTFNFFNELEQITNANSYYTTKHNKNSFELVIYNPEYLPECRKYLSCMTPEVEVLMPEDDVYTYNEDVITKSNRVANPPIRLTVLADREYNNVIHCNIEVNNRTGFYYLLSSDIDDYKNNIYACTLEYFFHDNPCSLALLLICSYCIYNPKAIYKGTNFIENRIIYKDYICSENDYPEIERIDKIKYTFYEANQLKTIFYDINKIDEIITKLGNIFKTAPHNIFSTLVIALRSKTLREFKNAINEVFKDLRNMNSLDEKFTEAYYIVRDSLKHSSYIDVLNSLIKYAQGVVISC